MIYIPFPLHHDIYYKLFNTLHNFISLAHKILTAPLSCNKCLGRVFGIKLVTTYLVKLPYLRQYFNVVFSSCIFSGSSAKTRSGLYLEFMETYKKIVLYITQESKQKRKMAEKHIWNK